MCSTTTRYSITTVALYYCKSVENVFVPSMTSAQFCSPKDRDARHKQTRQRHRCSNHDAEATD